MQRREFISLLGGAAAAWPLTARAQKSATSRIGPLSSGIADETSFKHRYAKECANLDMWKTKISHLVSLWEGKLDRLPELAAELVRLKVDVIVALYVPVR